MLTFIKIIFKTFLLIAGLLVFATADDDSIGYQSVDEAFQALKDNKNIKMELHPNGWLFGTDKSVKGQYTIWTFTPETHPAYPTVIKRIFTANGDKTDINMDIICQATDKESCQTLIKTFKKLNESLTLQSPKAQ